jgi:hypothetical protein
VTKAPQHQVCGSLSHAWVRTGATGIGGVRNSSALCLIPTRLVICERTAPNENHNMPDLPVPDPAHYAWHNR